MKKRDDRSGYARSRGIGEKGAMEIEVFRAGNAAADAFGITAADLADVAAFDCANNPVPCVIGHPMTDTPANGAIRSFRAEGNSLFADVPDDLPAFQAVKDGIKAKTILGRSMMFFGRNHRSNPTPGKVSPKHLGFLGAAVPGIAGMPALSQCFAFAADDTLEVTGDPAPAVVLEPEATPVIKFSAPADPAATQEPAVATEAEQLKADQDKLAADRKAHDDRVAAFAADQRTARETANAATVKAMVTAGQVLPADEADLVAAFNAVDGGEVIAFASDANKAKASPVSIIAAVMAKAGKATPVGTGQHTPTDDAPAFAAEGAVADLDKVRADRRAKYGS